jgi:hypothetical protein
MIYWTKRITSSGQQRIDLLEGKKRPLALLYPTGLLFVRRARDGAWRPYYLANLALQNQAIAEQLVAEEWGLA